MLAVEQGRAVNWPDDASEAVIADEAAAPAAAGKRRRGAAQGVAARDQPDDLAAPAGAEYVHPARAARGHPGRNGPGGHPPLSILP